MKILIYAIVIILSAFFVFGMWKLGRQINYSFNYKDMVKETIQENVKKECLK